MLKIIPHPEFAASVPITVPGQLAPVSVDFVFRHRSRESINELLRDIQGRNDADVLNELIVAWPGIEEDYNRENLAVFLGNYPAAAGEIFSGYLAALTESRVKN
jgi:hypothetical protein